MTNYFSTFISGMGELVSEALRSSLPDSRIELLMDGLVVYQSGADFNKVRQLRFLNNSFVLLESEKGGDSSEVLKKLVDKVIRARIHVPVERRTSFRIMFSKENQPISVEPETLLALERKFATKDLSVNRTNPGVELLFLARRDGYGFFGLRLTKHRDYKKTLHAGELRPELANLLCFLSEPKPNDVFLDPFAGYGAIPFERVSVSPYGRIYAGEKDPSLVQAIRGKVAKFGKRFVVGQWDATNLVEFQDASVDKTVTDPPWGMYSNGEDLEKLYLALLKEQTRVLKLGGILVLLTANKPLMDLCLPQVPELRLLNSYDILVSGKKATVYKLSKGEFVSR